MGIGKRGVRFQEEGKGLILPGLLYAYDLVLCSDQEKDLWSMVVRFVEVCIRRDLKFNAGKSKVMALSGQKGLECELCVDGIHLEHVSEFKYLGCALDKSGIDEAGCRGKFSGRRVTDVTVYGEGL